MPACSHVRGCLTTCVCACLLCLLVDDFVARTPAWRYDACKLNLLPQINDFETDEEALRLDKGEDGVTGVFVCVMPAYNTTRACVYSFFWFSVYRSCQLTTHISLWCACGDSSSEQNVRGDLGREGEAQSTVIVRFGAHRYGRLAPSGLRHRGAIRNHG